MNFLDRYFREIDPEHVIHLREYYRAIGHAFAESRYQREDGDGEASDRPWLIAGTYLRRAGAHTLLLGDFELASQCFLDAAKYYERAKSHYSFVMQAFTPPAALKEPNGPGQHSRRKHGGESSICPNDVYVLFQQMNLDDDICDVSDIRSKLRDLASTRLGVLATPLPVYLEMWEAVYETRSAESRDVWKRVIGEASLPLVLSYSTALRRARKDVFHWTRMAMPFHPLEPDVIGPLLMIARRLRRNDIRIESVIEALPVDHAAREVLCVFLGYWSKYCDGGYKNMEE